jgi:O-antigen biosynthesis protein WbqP
MAIAVQKQEIAGATGSYRARWKRVFDLLCVAIATPILIVPFTAVAILVKLTSRGPVLFWSDRVGVDSRIFQMPKFRSMLVDTPQLATHVLDDAKRYLTPIGSFIRKTSLDELPQLLSVIKGDLALVGPRPALFNQHDLVELRTALGIQRLVPGITGWAQVNGRDELSIPVKVSYDEVYLHKQSFLFDLKILGLTFVRVLGQSGIKH